MDGPDRGFREEIGYRALQARERDDEEELERVLEEVEQAIQRDLEERPPAEQLSEEDAWDQLAAIESWASVASNAAARFSAPASPWPRDVAGWGKKAVARLRRIANILKPALQKIVGVLHAAGCTIAVAFPWGISIGVTF